MKKASLLLATVLIWSFLVGAVQASDHKREGGKHSSKFYGIVETMPENGYEGIWIIGGNKVNVLPKTEIKEKHGIPAIGSYVEVEGKKTGEQFTAYSIEIDKDRESNTHMAHPKFYGTVEKMPQEGFEGKWRVNGRELLVTRNTRIKEKYGAASVGSYVEVKGDFAGKTFAVYEIEVKDNKHHNSHKSYNSKFSGKIERLPDEGYEGRWIVAGYQVDVNNTTVIDETAGKATPGGEARVKGIRSGRTIKASEITITALQ